MAYDYKKDIDKQIKRLQKERDEIQKKRSALVELCPVVKTYYDLGTEIKFISAEINELSGEL